MRATTSPTVSASWDRIHTPPPWPLSSATMSSLSSQTKPRARSHADRAAARSSMVGFDVNGGFRQQNWSAVNAMLTLTAQPKLCVPLYVGGDETLSFRLVERCCVGDSSTLEIGPV
eukprot:9470779-Pyramimonas_sp.AAC.2